METLPRRNWICSYSHRRLGIIERMSASGHGVALRLHDSVALQRHRIMVFAGSEAQGDTLTGNTGGPLACDATSYFITDLTPQMLGSSSGCRVSTGDGHHVHVLPPTSNGPKVNPVKAAEDRFRQLATKSK
jgi:hypothetical protein